jgi:hypothetical protein
MEKTGGQMMEKSDRCWRRRTDHRGFAAKIGCYCVESGRVVSSNSIQFIVELSDHELRG